MVGSTAPNSELNIRRGSDYVLRCARFRPAPLVRNVRFLRLHGRARTIIDVHLHRQNKKSAKYWIRSRSLCWCGRCWLASQGRQPTWRQCYRVAYRHPRVTRRPLHPKEKPYDIKEKRRWGAWDPRRRDYLRSVWQSIFHSTSRGENLFIDRNVLQTPQHFQKDWTLLVAKEYTGVYSFFSFLFLKRYL